MTLLNYNFYNWVKLFLLFLPPPFVFFIFFCYFMWRNNEKCSTNENIFQMWVYASERATYKILLWIFFNMACFCSIILLLWKVRFEFSCFRSIIDNVSIQLAINLFKYAFQQKCNMKATKSSTTVALLNKRFDEDRQIINTYL